MTQGRLFARLAVVNGRTRLVEHHQNAPLKIARCFETDGGGLEICVMDASPGLLAGDCNDFEWVLEAGARLRVTMQGATRVHPSDGPVSIQTTRFHVATGASLELWPHTVIPFRGARLETRMRGHLDTGAKLLLLDSLAAGRVARGEIFAFESIKTQILVYGAQGPLLCVQNRFVPGELTPSRSLAWRGATHLTTLYTFGLEDEKQAIAQVNHLLCALGDDNIISGAVSALARGGVAVSMQGQRAHDLHFIAAQIAELWRKMGFHHSFLNDINSRLPLQEATLPSG